MLVQKYCASYHILLLTEFTLIKKLGTHINLFGGRGLDTDWFAEIVKFTLDAINSVSMLLDSCRLLRQLRNKTFWPTKSRFWMEKKILSRETRIERGNARVFLPMWRNREDEEVEHLLLRLRNMLVTFIESCFFKHIPMDEKSTYHESEKRACIMNLKFNSQKWCKKLL